MVGYAWYQLHIIYKIIIVAAQRNISTYTIAHSSGLNTKSRKKKKKKGKFTKYTDTHTHKIAPHNHNSISSWNWFYQETRNKINCIRNIDLDTCLQKEKQNCHKAFFNYCIHLYSKATPHTHFPHRNHITFARYVMKYVQRRWLTVIYVSPALSISFGRVKNMWRP